MEGPHSVWQSGGPTGEGMEKNHKEDVSHQTEKIACAKALGWQGGEAHEGV